VLNNRIRTGKHQARVTVVEMHQIRRFAARSVDFPDLTDVLRLAHDLAVHMQPVPDSCLHHAASVRIRRARGRAPWSLHTRATAAITAARPAWRGAAWPYDVPETPGPKRRSMTRPSMSEVKSEGQPRWVVDRVNDEHVFGRLYMRRISPRATWVLARTGWSPNAVTLLFICCGVAAGVVIAFGGLATAIVAAVLVQLALLFDCSDGELARLTRRTSARGIYLDRVGHYLCEAAMLIGLGVRAQGELTVSGRYVTAGLAAAVLACLVKAETDNVVIARAVQGLGPAHGDDALAPRRAGLATLRRAASLLMVHRIIQQIELSVLVLLAAIADQIRGGLLATRVLLIACLIVAALMVVAHLAAIMTSRRLA